MFCSTFFANYGGFFSAVSILCYFSFCSQDPFSYTGLYACILYIQHLCHFPGSSKIVDLNCYKNFTLCFFLTMRKYCANISGKLAEKKKSVFFVLLVFSNVRRKDTCCFNTFSVNIPQRTRSLASLQSNLSLMHNHGKYRAVVRILTPVKPSRKECCLDIVECLLKILE